MISNAFIFFHEETCQRINDCLFSFIYQSAKNFAINLPPQAVQDLEIKIISTNTGSSGFNGVIIFTLMKINTIFFVSYDCGTCYIILTYFFFNYNQRLITIKTISFKLFLLIYFILYLYTSLVLQTTLQVLNNNTPIIYYLYNNNNALQLNTQY